MLERGVRRDAPARCPVDEPLLQQVRLVDVFHRVRLFADRARDRLEADGATSELRADRSQNLAIHRVEAECIHLESNERLVGEGRCDDAVPLHLGEVADAAQQAVCDARRAPAAARDLPAPEGSSEMFRI